MRAIITLLNAVAICICLYLIPQPFWGQQVTAAITGRVTDPSGAAIVGAKVHAQDTERGTLWPATTNGDGAYDLPRLPVGTYDVVVENPGFQAAQQSNILLVLNQTARLDFQLRIGNTTQSVEVTSAPPLLKTDSTQLDTVIDSRTNVALPLATRNFVQLTLLAPGSVTTNPSEFTGPEQSVASGRPYINGNREQANNFLIDGVDANYPQGNYVGYTPSPDAIEEFNMITQNASAEFGNFMGGIVSVSIKAGTNQFHGSAFEFLRNDQLNANTWSNNWNGLARPLMRWNEFGGSAGGPIIKNKLFVFGDYQGSRFDQPATSSPYTVLTAAERTGNFSQLGVQLHYPGTTTPIPGNILPASLLSQQAAAIMSSPLYPQPVNGGLTHNAVNTTHSYTNQDQGDIRADWNASDKDHIFGRYSQAYLNQPTTNSVPLLYNTASVYPIHNGVLDYTRTFSPSFVNDVRFGVNYVPALTGVVTGNGISAQSVGIPGVPTNILPAFSFSSGNLTGGTFGNADSQEASADNVIQIGDTAIITHGTHTMHIGFEATRTRLNISYSGGAGIAGQFSFSGQYTGAAEADFMAGLPTEVQGGINGGTWGQRSSLYAAFFQDDWRIARNLTLNLGLRYELNTPLVEVANRQSNFGLVSGQEYIAGNPCPYTNCRALYNNYNGIDNYQPRLGIAWTPWKNTVIRAAVTISSFMEGTGSNLRLPLNLPFSISHDAVYTATGTTTTLADGYNIFGGSDAANNFQKAALRIWDPNFRPAVSDQWNLTVQHQFGSSMTLQASYVGQRNTHMVVPIYASQEVLNPNGTVSPGYYLSGNPALRSEIGSARMTASSGNGDYNALQVSFQKRLSNGLEFQLNYTHSQCMTNAVGFYGTNGGQASSPDVYWPNAYNGSSQWGSCFFDASEEFNGYTTYDIPVGRGRKFGSNINKVANAVAGGWQVNTIVTLHGGFPLTIANFEDTSNTRSPQPRANCIAPAQVLGEYNSPTGGYQWFNPNSYASPAQGTLGNCGVGTVRGPGLATADLSLSKMFNFTERQNLEFRVEAINFTNTPIFNTPNTTVPGLSVSKGNNIGIGNFGTITSAQGARNIQFALKYHF
jgi:Carboxypeptidase regulatory-like domain/TonB dependent receptor